MLYFYTELKNSTPACRLSVESKVQQPAKEFSELGQETHSTKCGYIPHSFNHDTDFPAILRSPIISLPSSVQVCTRIKTCSFLETPVLDSVLASRVFLQEGTPVRMHNVHNEAWTSLEAKPEDKAPAPVTGVLG